MVMVFQIEHIPRAAVQLALPVAERTAQTPQGKLGRKIIREKAVGAHALKLDHHVHLRRTVLRDIIQRALRRDQYGFGQRHAGVVVEHITAELLQIFMDVRPVIIEADAAIDGEKMVIGKPLFFGDQGDDVLPEAVDAHIQPEAQNSLDLLAHEGVVHIQVGLFDGEQMQVVFLPHLVPLPRLAFKMAVPVVGQLAVFSGGTPDVIIRVRLNAAPRFLKPLMLVAGVVDDQIHDELHAALMQAVEHLAESLHAAIHGVDVHVVCDVIAAVCAGGGVERREPYAVHT